MNIERLIWSNYGKFLLLLLFVIVLLQGYHMMWLMKLHNSKRLSDESLKYTYDEEKTIIETSVEVKNDIAEDVIDKVNNVHLSDPSGSYFIIPNVIVAEGKNSEIPVTLCSQTTPNHLHYLKDLSESWDGPISVAIFTDHINSIQALYTALYMHTCFESVRKFVTFHLMYPIRLSSVDLNELSRTKINCDVDIENLFDKSETKLNYANLIPYPHNILRNVAITYSSSQYIFMIDIDMVPSNGLVNKFQHFIQRQNIPSNKKNSDTIDKVVYVVPAFESKVTIRNSDKDFLLYEWNAGNVRPFYIKVCEKCQIVTDYDKWRGLPNLPFLDIGYILEWEDPWEPFYIAKKSDLPLYDGRFKQYGFNRISQVCELHVVGYSFAVLNNAFVVHRGFKEKDQFHSKKENENVKNKKLFRTFKLDLKDRYPDITREC